MFPPDTCRFHSSIPALVFFIVVVVTFSLVHKVGLHAVTFKAPSQWGLGVGSTTGSTVSAGNSSNNIRNTSVSNSSFVNSSDDSRSDICSLSRSQDSRLWHLENGSWVCSAVDSGQIVPIAQVPPIFQFGVGGSGRSHDCLWRPQNCSIRNFTLETAAACFQKLYENKSLAFVGDSMLREHLYSPLMILFGLWDTAVLNVRNTAWHHMHSVSLTVNASNTRVNYVWKTALAGQPSSLDVDHIEWSKVLLSWTSDPPSVVVFSIDRWPLRYCARNNIAEFCDPAYYREGLRNTLQQLCDFYVQLNNNNSTTNSSSLGKGAAATTTTAPGPPPATPPVPFPTVVWLSGTVPYVPPENAENMVHLVAEWNRSVQELAVDFNSRQGGGACPRMYYWDVLKLIEEGRGQTLDGYHGSVGSVGWAHMQLFLNFMCL